MFYLLYMYPSRQQKQTNKHVNVHQRKLMIHLYNKNIIIKKKANEAASFSQFRTTAPSVGVTLKPVMRDGRGTRVSVTSFI